MPSTYSPRLRLELVGSGEQSGLWGDTTNKNLGTLVEQAIAGVAVIPLVAPGVYIVEALDGTSDEARCAVLKFTGSPGGAVVAQIPSTTKLYVVRNDTSPGQTVTVRTAAQVANPLLGGVVLNAGEATLVFSDGTLAIAGIATAGVGPTTVANGGTGATSFTGGFVKSPGGTSTLTSSATVNLATEVSGILPAVNGGTGGLLPATAGGTGTNLAPSAGQVLIGTTGGTYTPAFLTQGSGITITPSSGGITISASGAASGVTSVTGSGNISVSPTTGNVTVSMSSAPTFSSYVTSPTYYIGGSPGSMYILNNGGEMGFVVSGLQTAKVTSSGLGCQGLAVTTRATIGGGAAGGNYNLDVAGQSGQTAAFFTTTGSGGNGIAINAVSTGSLALFQSNGVFVGSITTSAGSTFYNTTSDRRLKSNIVPFTNAGPVIDAIKPRQFTWIETGQTEVGFIADELQQVVPNTVEGQPNAVDKDGNPIYQQVDVSTPEMIALMIAELQSLRKRVAALEAK
jgi:hypothetical protein